MADEKLERLLGQLYQVTVQYGATPDKPHGIRLEAVREAIRAHVREREVELMGLAWVSGDMPDEVTVQAFRARLTQNDEYAILESMRALRDAFDQAGGKANDG